MHWPQRQRSGRTTRHDSDETRLITKGHVARQRRRGDLYRADLTGEELRNLTVGLIGYGHIGTKLLQPPAAASGVRSVRCA